MPQLRRRRRRRPRRRRGDRPPPRPRRACDVLVVDRGRHGSRHAVDARADARRRAAALPGGVCSTGSSPLARRRSGAPRSATPVRPSRSTSSRRPASTRCTPRDRTVLDAILVDAATEAGADVRFGDHRHRRHPRRSGRVDRHARRGRRRAAARRRAPASSSAPTASARRSPARAAHRAERAGTGASACTYGYWSGLELDGYEWNFRPDAASGVIPTNDGQACVFASALPGGSAAADSTCSCASSPRSSPELADRLAAAERATCAAHVPWPTRLHPAIVRAGLGAGRRRRLLQGPAQRARPHRRPARRRAARPRRRRVSPTAPRATTPSPPTRRDATSCRPTCSTSSTSSPASSWTDAEIARLLLRLNAAMADEVDALSALPLGRSRTHERQAVALDVGDDGAGADALGEGQRLVDERPQLRRTGAGPPAGLGEEDELATRKTGRRPLAAGGDGRPACASAAAMSPTARAAWASAWSNGPVRVRTAHGDPPGERARRREHVCRHVGLAGDLGRLGEVGDGDRPRVDLADREALVAQAASVARASSMRPLRAWTAASEQRYQASFERAAARSNRASSSSSRPCRRRLATIDRLGVDPPGADPERQRHRVGSASSSARARSPARKARLAW